MGFDRIVCLANSYKHKHRCVAGISQRSKKWVRLVGTKVPGCLTIKETCYPDGPPAELLDVFEVELGEACGSNCHPEDVFVTDRPWRLIRRFDQPGDTAFLKSLASQRPTILQGYGSRLKARRVEERPMEHSLELVEPFDLWWWLRLEDGKRKCRALFLVSPDSHIRYDLPLTDPDWEMKLQRMPLGIHSHADVEFKRFHKPLLTLSLGEEFKGFHYKLVAGVIPLPG